MTAYLFLQGHELKKTVLNNLLSPAYKMAVKLENEKYTNLKNTQHKTAGQNNELNRQQQHFNNTKIPVETILETHRYYEACPLAQQIIAKIEQFKATSTARVK
jgi:hypothetical protein